jgi:plasmid maintenance system antidote protein VapI
MARYFGTSERFWMNHQGRYDLEVERDRLVDTTRRDHAAQERLIDLSDLWS